MKKKSIIITCACVAAALVIGGVGWFVWGRESSSKDDNVVYVSTVEKLMSLGSGNGLMNRFPGVVESQDTWKVQQNAEKVVKDILVEEGQEVQVGTPLLIMIQISFSLIWSRQNWIWSGSIMKLTV